MTTFLRLLEDKSKDVSLSDTCNAFRAGDEDHRVFQVSPDSFSTIPVAPFAYWASSNCLQVFTEFSSFQNSTRLALRTNGTTDDSRWIRAWWEIDQCQRANLRMWVPHAKGGAFSPFYSGLNLVIDWDSVRNTYPGYVGTIHRPDVRPASQQYFFLPGLTWSRRNSTGLSFRVLPKGAIFGDKGPGIFFADFDSEVCLAVSAIINSSAFVYLVSLQLGRFELAQSYEAGLIQKTPYPEVAKEVQMQLAGLAHRAWSLKRNLDTTTETSHAYLLPAALRSRLHDYDPSLIEIELADIYAEIDSIAFLLYGFNVADRQAALRNNRVGQDSEDDEEGDEKEEIESEVPPVDALLSWAIGVVFGRFDWRLASGERQAPSEPDPFDPLPAKSPGMLPDGAEPFHAHAGILVDDKGHPHDLARLVEEVLTRVEVTVPDDVRRWLQRDFFAFHLQRYSKSRRKAPIYWPLSTTSGSYTLWVYYPSLTSQTLYTAINDYIEPKIKDVGVDVAALRTKGTTRTRDDELQFEALQTLAQELRDLRDTLQSLAHSYQPNRDDGVQITAAPLWPLFRHKPWQKLLKDTWAKLEKGDCDWAHLAMAYWPDRVREKCKTDKSLAIAHDLEELYVEPEGAPKKTRGRKKADS